MSETNILNINSCEHSYYIKFYPEIKSYFGCEKATLILGRLEYWFAHPRYTIGFYKFVEPCGHPLYREGDSWSEELGFSRKIFAKAFDLIGVRYKSKSAFMNTTDRFQGKLYASYHDRKTNRTYFIRNHEFASQFLKNLFNRKTLSPSVKEKKGYTQKMTSHPKTSFSSKGRSWNGQSGRSSGGTIGGKDLKPIQRNNSSLEMCDSNSSLSVLKPEEKKVTEEMIEIWKKEVGELGVSFLSARFLDKLFQAFLTLFEQSLSAWKAYCRMIASSKFLMGEAKNKFFKKAWITWAIKEETIEKIKGGGFNLGDRETKLDLQVKEITHTIEKLENQKKEIENSIESVKISIKRKRLQKTREKIKSLSEERINQFKEEFEDVLEIENNAITQEFKKAGWGGTGLSTYFNFFIEEQVESLLFFELIEDEVNQAIKNSGLIEILDLTCSEIEEIKKKKIIFSQQMSETH